MTEARLVYLLGLRKALVDGPGAGAHMCPTYIISWPHIVALGCET